MFVSTKKHNELVLELAEANLDMQRYIKELENTVKEQFEILDKFYNSDYADLTTMFLAQLGESLTPIEYEEE